MAIQGGIIQKANKRSLNAKGNGKGKGKGKDKSYIPRPKNPKPSTKEYPTKNGAYHHCKEVGYCKRNCPAYLAELIKKKKQVGTASSSSIFIIELFSFPNKSSVYWLSIYETDMLNLVPNVDSIYNVSNKRAKHNLDSTFLWHCRLAHISKKRIKKLQQDGLLKSKDEESFDQCVSLLTGKMSRKLFPHRTEIATDLLGIIHTDVCGPLRHVSRQGASYFITFTDDYSRYGYIYLLKHKNEVFETFKQLTPPYTPQHNGVSERRNRTLLDIVRSMINLTTLPLSFWDYALETTTRILNMVLTKKVDKTLYELCGRAKELEEIQDEDTSPFENTSKIPMGVNGFEPPQEEVVPICRMDNSKRGYIPMQERLDLNKTQGASTPEEVKRMQNVPYASVNLGEPHWTAVKTIVKYLRNIKAMILVYGGNPEAKLKVDCYCNAGFETNRDDIKSQTGYVFVLN
ncbi:retrotransposon protein, putative, ty1-copia subclass [Tanacetum coccineum]